MKLHVMSKGEAASWVSRRYRIPEERLQAYDADLDAIGGWTVAQLKSLIRLAKKTRSFLALVGAVAGDRPVFRIYPDHAPGADRRLSAAAGARANQKIALLRGAPLELALAVVRIGRRDHSKP